jgi:hypothetical protein
MIWILFAVTGSISSSITLMAATSIGKFLPFGKLYLKEEMKENKKRGNQVSPFWILLRLQI